MSAGERAADAAARAAAQTRFDAPLVLEAGAGTGKTTVLVARVLAWCLGLGWTRTEQRLAGPEAVAPERIAEALLDRVVAITFTEAAAAEMESRALDAFAAISRGEAVQGFDAAQVAVEPALQRQRAAALLAGFDHLRFQTIHAFCRRILLAHPLEAGVHPRFSVDASGAVRAAAVRETLERKLHAIRETGDADFEALLRAGIGAPELEEVLAELVGSAVPARVFAADPLAPDRVQAWAVALHDAAAAFVAAEAGRLAAQKGNSVGRRVAEAASQTLAGVARGVETPEAFAAVVTTLQEIWQENLTKRLAEFAEGTPPKTELAAFDMEEREPLAAAAGRLHACVDALALLDPLALALLHRVVAPLLAEVEQRLAEQGAECFDALLRRTRELLTGDPDLARAVRGEIDQLLVDEFQDTDRVQCEIVAALALEGEAGERPALFLVGDPKQSVYGWRNADIGAYMRFVARACAVPGAARHLLCVNHRSVPALLEEVERIMAPVMDPVPDVQPPFQRLVPSDRNAAVEGSGTQGVPAVEYWWSDRWDEAIAGFAKTSAGEAVRLEAAQLAADLLRHAEHGLRWKQVAVLMRTTSDADQYLAALRDAGIPYVVDRDRDYYQRREVHDAASLVCSVLDPSDQIALVATLRSSWVGVPDAAWGPLWARDFPRLARSALAGHVEAQEPLRAAAEAVAHEIAAAPGLTTLAGWESSLVRAIATLAALRRCFETEPADAFVEALRTTTLLEASEAARYPGAFRVANLARFFREFSDLLEEHAGDVAQVLRAIRAAAAAQTEFYEGRPKDPDEDAVRVMTIHGAKGLDFDHVYLMQTHKGSGASARPFERELRDGRVEWRLGLGSVRAATLGWSEVVTRRVTVGRAESVRTLYVALTRAKHRVVIAGRLGGDARASGTHAGWVWRAREAALTAARERMLERRAEVPELCADSADGALVRWLGLASTGASASIAQRRAVQIPLDRIRSESEHLAACDRAARSRAARRYLGRASEQVADVQREAVAARQVGEREPGARGDGEAAVGAAVGTALHALLERFDWNATDLATEWAKRSDEVRASLGHVPHGVRDVAVARADAVLAALEASELWALLRALAPYTLARELPVLLTPDDESAAAVGGTVGAIDWIYWDRDAQEPVVVDFKTDRVASAAEIEARAKGYRAPAERYRRATEQALGLSRPPRVELWFLAADVRVEVPR